MRSVKRSLHYRTRAANRRLRAKACITAVELEGYLLLQRTAAKAKAAKEAGHH